MKVESIQTRWRGACQLDSGIIGFADGLDPRIHQASWQLIKEKSVKKVVIFCRDLLELQATIDSFGNLYGDEGRSSIKHTDLGPTPGLSDFSDHLIQCVVVAPGHSTLMVAAEYLKAGLVHSVLAGNLSTTSDVIRAAIKGVGLLPGIKTVSGSFVMVSPQNKSYLFADCGVVIEPTMEQLVDIAEATALTWNTLGLGGSPRVAFLSFSSRGSAHHYQVEKVALAAQAFQKKWPQIISDGELQFDAAFVAEVAKRKVPSSPLNGDANCFIFPNLNAGNIAYKVAQRMAGYLAFGPILQGLAKPYSDLSRGASVEDIVTCSYINQVRGKLGHRL